MAYNLLKEDEVYSLENYPEFCEVIKNLSKKHFEIGWHGYNHSTDKSNGDEFRYLDKSGAITLFEKMFAVASAVDMFHLFKPIFRPPSLYMSPASFDAAKEMGIKVLALSPKEVKTREYMGQDKNFDRVVYYTCNPPDRPLKLSEKTEIFYHACEWDRSYLNKEKTEELNKFLECNREDIQFVFLMDM
jgi:hypothetical protein